MTVYNFNKTAGFSVANIGFSFKYTGFIQSFRVMQHCVEVHNELQTFTAHTIKADLQWFLFLKTYYSNFLHLQNLPFSAVQNVLEKLFLFDY